MLSCFPPRTVRVSISTKEEFQDKRVKIGVLVTGEQEGYQHVRHVRTANYIFSQARGFASRLNGFYYWYRYICKGELLTENQYESFPNFVSVFEAA